MKPVIITLTTGFSIGVLSLVMPLPVNQFHLAAQPAYAAKDKASNKDVKAIAKEVHQQINRYRAKNGLAALAWNEALSTQAAKHSQNMASGKVSFGHDGFPDRLKRSKVAYNGAAENVSSNSGFAKPADQAVKDWLKSAAHKSNIDGDYTKTGIGVARNARGELYFTQIFIN
jgi:uncharacterized protein YkwD